MADPDKFIGGLGPLCSTSMAYTTHASENRCAVAAAKKRERKKNAIHARASSTEVAAELGSGRVAQRQDFT